MSSNSRKQLEEWIKKIPKISGNILDVGGSQFPIQDRVNYEKESQFIILDLETPHEVRSEPDIVFDINKMIDRDKHIQAYEHLGSFDYVFCLEVSEYLYNPIQALTNMRYFLKLHTGLLYISFHFIYPVHEPYKYDTLRYTPIGVEKILNEAGFEIVDSTQRIANDSYLQAFYANEKMRPSKKWNNHNIVGSLVTAKPISI